MEWQETIQLLLVLCIALPAAFRNYTALALAGSYFWAWGVYELTGAGVSPQTLFLGNCAVIAAMLCKEPWRDCDRYRSLRHQLACLWTERTPGDMAILAFYPAAWTLYLNVLPAYETYWFLWFIFAAQVLIAGGETLALLIAARLADARQSDEAPMPRQEFALCGSRLGYGQ